MDSRTGSRINLSKHIRIIMEYFSRRLYDLQTECKEYIKSQMKKLADEQGEFYLADKQAVEDNDYDGLCDLPITTNEGRYNNIYFFRIYKIELAKNNDLWFHGIETDEADDYAFGENELDSVCLIEVASHLQSLNEKAK